MKKKLGALVLTLASLVLSAACASSGASTTQMQPEPEAGEFWAQARPSQRPAPSTEVAALRARTVASREER